MHSYNTFRNKRLSPLFENEDDSRLQIQGVKNAIQNGFIEANGFGWNDEGGIDFGRLNILSTFFGKSLEELPFNIQYVENFTVTSGKIRNLIGGPKECADLDVSYGQLTSLEGSPQTVGRFDAGFNMIRSLKGCPKYISGNINLSNNVLSDLNYGPYIILGKSSFNWNPRLENTKNSGVNIVTLFNKMHEDINTIYAKGEEKISLIFRKIEDAIQNKEYAQSLILKDPYYSIFLKEFNSEIKDLEYLKDIKDMGLL